MSLKQCLSIFIRVYMGTYVYITCLPQRSQWHWDLMISAKRSCIRNIPGEHNENQDFRQNLSFGPEPTKNKTHETYQVSCVHVVPACHTSTQVPAGSDSHATACSCRVTKCIFKCTLSLLSFESGGKCEVSWLWQAWSAVSSHGVQHLAGSSLHLALFGSFLCCGTIVYTWTNYPCDFA